MNGFVVGEVGAIGVDELRRNAPGLGGENDFIRAAEHDAVNLVGSLIEHAGRDLEACGSQEVLEDLLVLSDILFEIGVPSDNEGASIGVDPNELGQLNELIASGVNVASLPPGVGVKIVNVHFHPRGDFNTGEGEALGCKAV